MDVITTWLGMVGALHIIEGIERLVATRPWSGWRTTVTIQVYGPTREAVQANVEQLLSLVQQHMSDDNDVRRLP